MSHNDDIKKELLTLRVEREIKTMQTTQENIILNSDRIEAIRLDRIDLQNKSNTIIKEQLSLIKEMMNKEKAIYEGLSNKSALKLVKQSLLDTNLDNKTKDCIKVALSILDGYKLKTEFLSLPTMLKLISINKEEVNKTFKYNLEDYTDAIKELLNEYKVIKTVKVFSVSLAKEGR